MCLAVLQIFAQARQYRAIERDVEERYGREIKSKEREEEKRQPLNNEVKEQDEHPPLDSAAFEPDNPLEPHNWSSPRKWTYTIIVCATSFLASGAASFDTEVVPHATKSYDLHGTSGEQIALMATTLYMVCFGLGSPVAAPLSEAFGRNPIYLSSLVCLTAFSLGSAAAPDVQTWIVCRAFMGLFASPPGVIFAGSAADMWSPRARTYILPVLSIFVFLGPFLAPTIAAFIATSPLVDWHWTSWLTAIMAGSLGISIALFVPETYGPALRAHRQKCLHTKISNEQGVNMAGKLRKNFLTPWLLLVTEPILAVFTLYLLIIYAVLFGLLEGFSYIFGTEGGYYNLSQTGVGLCFLAIDVGFLAVCPIVAWVYPRYMRKLKEGHGKVVPEERLWYAMYGAPALPISIFWMAWTPPSGVSFWCPLVASGVFGFASLAIFLSIYQYVIDGFETVCASALCGMTISRYFVGAAMIHASIPMIQRLGVPRALTIWACLATVMAPVPFLLYWKGHMFRGMSRRAVVFESG